MEKRKILIIAATDLSDNNSASLCHSAYIRGFADAGHDVHVLTVKPISNKAEHEIKHVSYHYVSDENIIVKYVRKNRQVALSKNSGTNSSLKSRSVLNRVKSWIVGHIGATSTWMGRIRSFVMEEYFDLVLSLSSPPTSHEAAHKLISRGNVKTKRWCQLWEDPWSTDLYQADSSVREKEREILNTAQKILYVSPLTLNRQKGLFPESAEKMEWLPLPTYFDESQSEVDFVDYSFGYFGQYFQQVRNIRPVYEVLNELGLNFTICGEPHNLLSRTNTTHIYPRISPQELRVIEEEINVLVFVANLGGGQIPGKIYQYSGSRKAILFILDGNEYEKKVLREYFGQFNRYIFAENNKDSIKSAIADLIAGKYGNLSLQPVDYFDACNISSEILKINSLL